ncbi:MULTISPECIES: hypothetical protein [Kamptonema]|uniref:hypothetical protein n=1 Tax=Kamptonema TaxID=1501433 RepID=UPI0001DAD2CF|nr:MULTISPECIES: hypothetical protein [Kamptonema]CBN54077.1 hypothetical protein OSCI_3840010 [Kamptonema sp. PCC 6506]
MTETEWEMLVKFFRMILQTTMRGFANMARSPFIWFCLLGGVVSGEIGTVFTPIGIFCLFIVSLSFSGDQEK